MSVPARIRRKVRDRSGGLCERCGQRPIASMHHRLLRARGGDLIEDEWNIVGLCGSGTTGCHGLVHATNEAPWIVAGRVLLDKLTGRPVYTGPDLDYRERYPLAA